MVDNWFFRRPVFKPGGRHEKAREDLAQLHFFNINTVYRFSTFADLSLVQRRKLGLVDHVFAIFCH